MTVGLLALKQLVLIEFILDMQKHHDHDIFDRILLIQLLVLLEIFAGFELLEIFECLLQEVVLILQVCEDSLLQVGVSGRVLIAVADHGVLGLEVATCVDPGRILQLVGDRVIS